jgi:predicted Zn-dependent peptidase
VSSRKRPNRSARTLSSNAGRDDSSSGISALQADVDRALALLAEVVREPAFERKEFERVRAEMGRPAGRRAPGSRAAGVARGLRVLNGA